MAAEMDPILRITHVVLGAAGFLTGAAAIFIPKFRKTPAVWHRWIGRLYAISMTGMALVSIPLAIWGRSILLFVIGIVTLFWVIAGWVMLRRVRNRLPGGGRVTPSSRLQWHVLWMGSSYIAAWTAFLVNVMPFGESLPWMIFYGAFPSMLGTFFIRRAVTRLSGPQRRMAERVTTPP